MHFKDFILPANLIVFNKLNYPPIHAVWYNPPYIKFPLNKIGTERNGLIGKKSLHTSVTLLAGFQWLFLFANTVVIPISIGSAFQLSLLKLYPFQRSFIFTGAACLLQGLSDIV